MHTGLNPVKCSFALLRLRQAAGFQNSLDIPGYSGIFRDIPAAFCQVFLDLPAPPLHTTVVIKKCLRKMSVLKYSSGSQKKKKQERQCGRSLQWAA
jgi:hypothetical protein